MQEVVAELTIAEITQVVEQAEVVEVNNPESLIQAVAAAADDMAHQMEWAIPEEAAL